MRSSTNLALFFVVSPDSANSVYQLLAVKILAEIDLSSSASTEGAENLRRFLARMEEEQKLLFHRDLNGQLVFNQFKPGDPALLAGITCCRATTDDSTLKPGSEQVFPAGFFTIPYAKVHGSSPAQAIARVIVENLELEESSVTDSSSSHSQKSQEEPARTVYLNLVCKKNYKGQPKELLYGEFSREKLATADYSITVEDKAKKHFDQLGGDLYLVDCDFINQIRATLSRKIFCGLFSARESLNDFLNSIRKQAYAQLYRKNPNKTQTQRRSRRPNYQATKSLDLCLQYQSWGTGEISANNVQVLIGKSAPQLNDERFYFSTRLSTEELRGYELDGKNLLTLLGEFTTYHKAKPVTQLTLDGFYLSESKNPEGTEMGIDIEIENEKDPKTLIRNHLQSPVFLRRLFRTLEENLLKETKEEMAAKLR